MKTIPHPLHPLSIALVLLAVGLAGGAPPLAGQTIPVTLALPLPLSTNLSGALTLPAQQDRFAFEGSAGQRLCFDTLDSDGDALSAVLFAPSSNLVWQLNANNDGEPFYLKETGTHTLVLLGYGDATGDYSFRMLDLAAAQPLTLGAITSGRLDPLAEMDAYRFVGTAGQRLNFENLLASLPDANWRLIAPFGHTLLFGNIGWDLGEAILPASGTYVILVQGTTDGAGTLDYQIRASVVSNPSGTPIGFGAVHTDTLEAGETNTFAYTAPAGTLAYFDSLDASSGSLWMDLRAPDGSIYFSSLASTDHGPLLLPLSGNYTLEVRGTDALSSGPYSLRLLDLASGATALAYGAEVTGTLSPGYQTAVYRFTGSVGQRLLLDFLGPTSAEVLANLIAPSGTPVWLGWGGPGGEGTPVTLTEPGLHHLFVTASSAAAAEYTFRLIHLAQAPAVPLALNTTTSGTLSNSWQADVYRFNGTAGERWFLNGLVSSPGRTVRVFGPGDQFLWAHDLSADYGWVLPQTGTYALVVAASTGVPGPYQFSVLTPATTTAPLTLGSVIAGMIASPGDEHRYTFTGTVGQRLYYDGLDADFDNLNVRLLLPDGTMFFGSWGSDYDSGPLTLTQAGLYTLVVGGDTDTVGDFRFRLIDVGQSPAAALVFNDAVTGLLDPPVAVAVYRFEGTAEARLFLDSLDPNTTGTWTVYDPNNNPQASMTLGTDYVLTLPSSGRYVITVAAYGATAPVSYSFNVRTPGSTPAVLTLGGVTQGTLASPGVEHRYLFSGTVGMRLYYDAQDDDFDNISAQLVDPAGTVLSFGNADYDFGPVTLTQTGTYALVVGGQADTLGDYRFRLLDLASATALSATASGTLDPPDETDLYRFDGSTGERVLLESVSASSPQATWRLIGLYDQPSLASGDIHADLPETVLPAAGTYYVLVEGWAGSPSPMSYQIRRTMTVPAGTPSGFGVVHAGSIGPGDEHVFHYTAPAGLLVYFDGQSPTYDPVVAELRDPADDVIFWAYVVGDSEPVVLPRSGTYTLTIKGVESSSSGAYQFRLLNLASDSTALTLATVVTPTLAPSETEFYHFNGNAGQRLFYDALTNQSLNSMSLRFFGPGGRYLLNAGPSGAHYDNGPLTLAATGVHYLAFGSSQSGDVEGVFRLLDSAQAPASPIGIGELKSGTLNPGLQSQVYRLTISGQRRLLVHGSGTDFNATWTLHTPEDAWVGSGNVVGDSELDLPAQNGTYLLLVSGAVSAPVPYALELRVPTVVTQTLTLDATVTRAFAGPGDEHHLTFAASAGQCLYYDALEADYDPIYVDLVSPSGQTLFRRNADSDYGPFALAESGTYTLVFDSTAFATADYRFRLLDVASQPTVTMDTATSGNITTGYQAQLFRLQATAGLRLLFNSLGNDPGGIWGLSTLEGATLGGSALSGDFDATPELPGTHLLVVNNESPGSASYSFEVIPGNHPPALSPIGTRSVNEETPLTFSASATDPESPNDLLTFSLDPGAPAGAQVHAATGAFAWTPTESQGPGDYPVTIRVTDDGVPSLSAAETINIRVNEVNRPPVLTVPPTQTVDEQTTLTVTNTATDPDLPANGLTFALVNGPSGVTINGGTGVLSWTPGEDQGPSTNLLVVKVTDNNPDAVNATQLSVTNSFTVVVREVNRAPVLTVPPTQTLDEQTTLTVTNTATDPDLPANGLTFALVNGPSGVTINGGTGVLSWTPGEDQGPSTNLIAVKVTDNNPAAVNATQLSVTNSFTVVVREVNRAPVLTVPPTQTLDEQTTLTVTNTATDPDSPANGLTFALVNGPSGVTINGGTGVLSWTPGEDQGPSTNLIAVKVTDNNPAAVNATQLSMTNSFTVVVREVNRAPVLTPIEDRTIHAGASVTLQAVAADPDIPANVLAFSLDSAPLRASIDPSSGVFLWASTSADAGSTNLFTVRVADSGLPIRSTTTSFSIVVVAPLQIESISVSGGSVTLRWAGIDGQSYRVQYRGRLDASAWTDLAGDVSPVGGVATHTDHAVGTERERYYRVRVLP